MSPQELESIISRGENDAVELKSSLQPPAEVAKHIAALANTRGGHLIIGVAEPDHIAGVDPVRATDVLERALRMIKPSIRVDTAHVQIAGKSVTTVNVPRADKPISSQSGYYFRNGSSVAALTAQMLEARATEHRTPQEGANLLAEAVAAQTRRIDGMTAELEKSNSWLRKLIVAAAGALVGAAIKHAFDAWL